MKLKDIKIEMPKKLAVSKKDKEEYDRKLFIKKLNGYGFFDKNGKWKEK